MKDAIRQMIQLAINNAIEVITNATARIVEAEVTIHEMTALRDQAEYDKGEAQALLEIINEALGTDPEHETPGVTQAIIANVAHELKVPPPQEEEEADSEYVNAGIPFENELNTDPRIKDRNPEIPGKVGSKKFPNETH